MAESLDGMDRTYGERIAFVRNFILQEHQHRARMLDSHPDKTTYWRGRIDEAEEALGCFDALSDEE